MENTQPKMIWDDDFIIIDGITYLYVIYSTSGYFKIGITKNPAKRIKNIDRGTLTPFENKYLVTIPFTDEKAAEMEKLFHHKHKSKRVNGEWFDLDPFDIASFAQLEARIGHHHIQKIMTS